MRRKSFRPLSPSEVVRGGRKAVNDNKGNYVRRISIREDIIKTKFMNTDNKNNSKLKRRKSKYVSNKFNLPQPRAFSPVPEKRPINVQEVLKLGSQQLKQDVEELLSRFGNTTSFNVNHESDMQANNVTMELEEIKNDSFELSRNRNSKHTT
jgi:hypothetical protein